VYKLQTDLPNLCPCLQWFPQINSAQQEIHTYAR
jgi:hypothetical protein